MHTLMHVVFQLTPLGARLRGCTLMRATPPNCIAQPHSTMVLHWPWVVYVMVWLRGQLFAIILAVVFTISFFGQGAGIKPLWIKSLHAEFRVLNLTHSLPADAPIVSLSAYWCHDDLIVAHMLDPEASCRGRLLPPRLEHCVRKVAFTCTWISVSFV